MADTVRDAYTAVQPDAWPVYISFLEFDDVLIGEIPVGTDPTTIVDRLAQPLIQNGADAGDAWMDSVGVEVEAQLATILTIGGIPDARRLASKVFLLGLHRSPDDVVRWLIQSGVSPHLVAYETVRTFCAWRNSTSETRLVALNPLDEIERDLSYSAFARLRRRMSPRHQ